MNNVDKYNPTPAITSRFIWTLDYWTGSICR